MDDVAVAESRHHPRFVGDNVGELAEGKAHFEVLAVEDLQADDFEGSLWEREGEGERESGRGRKYGKNMVKCIEETQARIPVCRSGYAALHIRFRRTPPPPDF